MIRSETASTTVRRAFGAPRPERAAKRRQREDNVLIRSGTASTTVRRAFWRAPSGASREAATA